MKINICIASDNNYVQPLSVTMASILKNANIDDELFFYILDGGIEKNNKIKILELNKIKKCNISFFKADDSLLKTISFSVDYSYLTSTAFYRLKISSLLPKDIDKIIYLDCDIIVLKSLKELFLENIDNYFIGAIEDIWEYNIHNMFFINSGVMLINLKLWRQEKIEQKLIEYAVRNKVNYQITINYVFGDKIKPLDYKWNLQNTAFFGIYNYLLEYVRRDEVVESFKNMCIIHYIGKNKPWNSVTYLGYKYMKYVRLSSFNDIKKLKNGIRCYISFIYYTLQNIKYKIKYLIYKTK